MQCEANLAVAKRSWQCRKTWSEMGQWRGVSVMDVVSPKVRSRMMSGIRAQGTAPERLLRKLLFARGFRYRLHDKRLPGTPDMVFPRYRAVIQSHGCFWHGHGCSLFRWPATRQAFWREKITTNRRRDSRSMAELAQLGWRVLIVWECVLKGRERWPLDVLQAWIENWLMYAGASMELPPFPCSGQPQSQSQSQSLAGDVLSQSVSPGGYGE
ncbi:MAG: very short patch repair endonuclease [Kistimonas sp.]|nr:very short patch repair endonuclease [Kistimonas sp.]